MTVKTVWILLPGLASAGLLALGLLAGQPPRPAEGPLPPVLVGTEAAGGLEARFLPDVTADTGMLPLPARVTGRAARDGQSYLHQWPAFHASARFAGTEVAVELDDPGNRYRLTLDGAEIRLTRVGRGLLRLSGLGAGPHEIRLEKLSERADIGRFGGFFLPADGDPLPPPAPRPLIEFIGDSDTVGYGDTATGRDCSAEAQFLATDSSRAYGPMAARALGADYRVIAASGIRLVGDAEAGFPGMASLYETALPLHPERQRAPEQPADLIVIGIGSNDYGDRENLSRLGDPFEATLLEFMRARRAEAPKARIVLLAFGEYGRDLVEAHGGARDAFATGGDHADLVVLPELARTACHWHPSLNDHQVIAQRLVDLLGPVLRFSAP